MKWIYTWSWISWGLQSFKNCFSLGKVIRSLFSLFTKQTKDVINPLFCSTVRLPNQVSLVQLYTAFPSPCPPCSLSGFEFWLRLSVQNVSRKNTGRNWINTGIEYIWPVVNKANYSICQKVSFCLPHLQNESHCYSCSSHWIIPISTDSQSTQQSRVTNPHKKNQGLPVEMTVIETSILFN